MRKLSYEELMLKAEVCLSNALRCETEWAKDFWKKTAEDLKAKALALKLNQA